jgi:hypothetical protein
MAFPLASWTDVRRPAQEIIRSTFAPSEPYGLALSGIGIHNLTILELRGSGISCLWNVSHQQLTVGLTRNLAAALLTRNRGRPGPERQEAP